MSHANNDFGVKNLLQAKESKLRGVLCSARAQFAKSDPYPKRPYRLPAQFLAAKATARHHCAK